MHLTCVWDVSGHWLSQQSSTVLPNHYSKLDCHLPSSLGQ